MAKNWREILQKLDDSRWLLPASYKPGMRVPGLIYSSEEMLDAMAEDEAFEQVANVAFLPGIEGYSYAMPDIHWGYGFPIGGVAATREEDGVVSPGGVGFDINCGARLLRTSLREEDVRPRLKQLVDQVFRDIPAGMGGHGPVKIDDADLDQIMLRGAAWMVDQGIGTAGDLASCESGGCLPEADPDRVSRRARQRGMAQLATLGSGNHFLELQAVEAVYDAEAARVCGIDGPGQVVVFFHCGSRGFGHQVCQDYLEVMERASRTYGIELPDKQLACAPILSDEGQAYLGAMRAAANFAWANRQAIGHWVRLAFARVLQRPLEELGMSTVYDVAHNIAKMELHDTAAGPRRLCVHRKGATRAFPPGHEDLPERYRALGQPVLIPGDMGRYSYLCVGTERAFGEAWGSTCHGAGRVLSRGAAKRLLTGQDLVRRLEEQGIVVRCQNKAALAEEASEAYKDVADVVEVVEAAGLSRRVARFRPLGVIKG
jgi:tRNA-splicing ligase RtcB